MFPFRWNACARLSLRVSVCRLLSKGRRASPTPVSSGRTIAGGDREHSSAIYVVIGVEQLLLPAPAPCFQVGAQSRGVMSAVLDHRHNNVETKFVNERAKFRIERVDHGH